MSKSRIPLNQLSLTSSFTEILSILDECIRQEWALIDLEAKGSHDQVIEGGINEINLLNSIKTRSQRLPILLNQDQTHNIDRCILREQISLLETELHRRQEIRSQNSNITQHNENKNEDSKGDASLNLNLFDQDEQLQEELGHNFLTHGNETALNNPYLDHNLEDEALLDFEQLVTSPFLDPAERSQESKQVNYYLNPSSGSITTNSVFQPTPVAVQTPMLSSIAPHIKPEIDDGASLPPLKQLKKE